MTSLDGLPITTVARTALDVARRVSTLDAQMVVDAAARAIIGARQDEPVSVHDLRRLVHDDDERHHAMEVLRSCATRQAGWPGIRRARRAVSWAEPASESPAESWSRARFLLWDLPQPKCGAPIVIDDVMTLWADFLWTEQQVIGECDGASKYVDPDVLVREKRRQLQLERAGYSVVRWMPGEVLTGDQDLRQILRAVLT